MEKNRVHESKALWALHEAEEELDDLRFAIPTDGVVTPVVHSELHKAAVKVELALALVV